jgi:putative BNR repeat neuraminidase
MPVPATFPDYITNGIGNSFGGFPAGNAGPYLPTNSDAKALIAAMTATGVTPSTQYQIAINTFYTALGSTILALLAELNIMAAQTAAHGALNWADDGATTLTQRNSPTFTAGLGFTGNGTNSDLLGPTFTSMNSKYTQNNASAGVWTATDVVNATFPMATDTASQAFLINGPGVSHLGLIRPNNTTGTSNFHSWYNGKMLCAFSRSSSTIYNLFVNNQKEITTLASNGVPSSAHLTYLSASGTTFSTKTVCAGWVGAALTDDQFATLVQAVNAYLTTVGAFDATVWGLEGAWTWFNDPRVLTMPTGNPLIGAVDFSGDVVSGQVQTTNSFNISRNNIVAALQVDDHDNPAYLIRSSDSRVLAFYTKHGVSLDTSYFMAVSVNAADGNVTFNAPTNIGTQFSAGGANQYSYAEPFELTGESILIVFFRAQFPGFYTRGYSTSSDQGTTWSAATQLLWDGRPYTVARQTTTTRIDFIVSSGNPTDGIFAYNNIYHIYRNSGSWFAPDGTSLGSPPFTQAQLEGTSAEVYDSIGNSGILAWNWDTVRDSGGNIYDCYAKFPVTTPAGQDHEYYQNKWNGSSWTERFVCAGGGNIYPSTNQSGGTAQPYYSGGIITDPLNPGTIYCSRLVDSNGNPVTAVSGTGTPMLYKGVYNGSSFVMTALNVQGFRPYIMQDGTRTLWFVQGTYTEYDIFSTAIKSMAI